jgi:hypothetical protein
MRHLLVLLPLLVLLGCAGDGPLPEDFEDADAPASIDGLTIQFDEDGGDVSNTWEFGASTATLVGSGDFPYTYEDLGGADAELVFDVQGEDVYELFWTSETGGTFEQSFDGGDVTPGVFEVQTTAR